MSDDLSLSVLSEEPPLSVQVAQALGWTNCSYRACYDVGSLVEGGSLPSPPMAWRGVPPWEHSCGSAWDGEPCTCDLTIRIPDFEHDWSETGLLIQRYKIELSPRGHGWVASRDWPDNDYVPNPEDPQVGKRSVALAQALTEKDEPLTVVCWAVILAIQTATAEGLTL